MNDERLRALYAGAMERMPRPEDAQPVSLEAMVDVLERRGSEAERSRTLRAILRDPRARGEFELLRAVTRAAEPPRASWKSAVMWRVAAAVTIMLGTAWLFTELKQPADPLRGGEAAVTTVAPADGAKLRAPPLFVWRPVPQATEYRIAVVDSAGVVVFEETVSDTVSTGPVSGGLVPGQRYRWSITTLTTEGRNLSSRLSAFELGAP